MLRCALNARGCTRESVRDFKNRHAYIHARERWRVQKQACIHRDRHTDRLERGGAERERDLPGGIIKDEFTADDTIVAADQTFILSFVFYTLF